MAVVTREALGFLMMEEYVRRFHNTVTQYIDTRSLLDLCEGLERAPGARVGMRWWEQEGLDLAGVREQSVAAEDGEEEGSREEAVWEEITSRI